MSRFKGIRGVIGAACFAIASAASLPASATIVVSDALTFTNSGVLIDFWALDVTGAGTVSLDMRSEHGGFDANGDGFASFADLFITIATNDGSYDTGDVLFQSDDNGGVIDGSTHSYDSYLSVFLNAGSYLLIVQNCCDFGGADAVDGIQYNGTDVTNNYSGWAPDLVPERGYQITGYGDATYTLAGYLNVGSTEVPAPGALMLLGFGLLGIGAARRRLN